MQENKQESTRVCHALRHTFPKLSPAHDMKAIIDLACFPYNLDRAFSRVDMKKKKDERKNNSEWTLIIPVLRSSHIKQLNLKVWPSAFGVHSQHHEARHRHNYLWTTRHCVYKCTISYLDKRIHTYLCACQTRQTEEIKQKFPQRIIIFPHWRSLSWDVAKRHKTSYCSINTKGLIPSQMCVNALRGCWALNVWSSLTESYTRRNMLQYSLEITFHIQNHLYLWVLQKKTKKKQLNLSLS